MYCTHDNEIWNTECICEEQNWIWLQQCFIHMIIRIHDPFPFPVEKQIAIFDQMKGSIQEWWKNEVEKEMQAIYQDHQIAKGAPAQGSIQQKVNENQGAHIDQDTLRSWEKNIRFVKETASTRSTCLPFPKKIGRTGCQEFPISYWFYRTKQSKLDSF